MESQISENLSRIRDTLSRESAPWGRLPRLVVVTKTAPCDTILSLADMGVTDIAENRVQSLLEKFPQISGKFRLHMIGRLQTNKVKYIMEKVCFIHSLDRLPLALEIDRRAQEAGTVMPVLLQVNIAGEPQKAGVAPDELPSLLQACARLPGLKVNGLMAVMPRNADRESLGSLFRDMRKLFDRAASDAIDGVFMEELSMGMSQDYDLAARAGATMVRIGSAVFANLQTGGPV